MRKIVLDNRRITTLSSDPTIVKEFPFFGLRKDKRGCCGRKAGTEPDFIAIRQKLVNLSDDQKEKFKKLLRAESVMVHFHNGQSVYTMSF